MSISCNRKSLNISRKYSLSTASCRTFFASLKLQMDPLVITSFDASNCYWITVEGLRKPIVQMSNLRELNIQGSQLGLVNLPIIFKACQKIVGLSFTLLDQTLAQHKRNSDAIMRQGFGRLTRLKIFANSVDENRSIEFWLVILGVLTYTFSLIPYLKTNSNGIQFIFLCRWSQHCEELFLEIPYSAQVDQNDTKNRHIDRRNKNVIQQIKDHLEPNLVWMRSSLKSLTILRHHENTKDLIDHPILDYLLNGWLFRKGNDSLWHSLVHVWVENYSFKTPAQNAINIGPPMNSVLLPKRSNVELLKNEARFKDLHHLGGIGDSVLFQPIDYLPNLTFIRGATSDAQVLSFITFFIYLLQSKFDCFLGFQ